MIRLTRWRELIRGGVPPMVVINRPLLRLGETLEVGAVFPPLPNPDHMRVLYEQRMIAPLAHPPAAPPSDAPHESEKPATSTPAVRATAGTAHQPTKPKPRSRS